MHKIGRNILLLQRLKYLKTLNFLELKSRFIVLISLAQQSQLYAWNEVGLIPCKAHALPTSETAGTDMNIWGHMAQTQSCSSSRKPSFTLSKKWLISCLLRILRTPWKELLTMVKAARGLKSQRRIKISLQIESLGKQHWSEREG